MNKDTTNSELIQTDHIPNAFMTRKNIIDSIGGFDRQYFIMYEEADFAARIRKLKKDIVVECKAVTYHNIPLPKECVENEMRI